MSNDPPSEYLCPITMDLLEDPYTDNQGISYSKKEIIKWLQNNSISPSTRKPLTVNDLTPNLALKSLIEQWKKENPNYSGINLKSETKHDIDITNKLESIAVYDSDTNSTSIQITAPELPKNENRLPVEFIFCVDVSGSMGTAAIVKGEEDSGLSVLDLVKHAIKTLTKNMNEKDRVTLITYNNCADIKCHNIKMNNIGMNIIEAEIDKMVPGGSTNIWDGLFKSMESIDESNSNPYIMLFTDGQPTVSPPRGERYYLSKYIEEKSLKAPIYTYGFGNHLDTELLNDIAITGNGRFGFIPDIGFVGTIFVHSQANILSNMGKNITIKIECNGLRENNILGNHKTSIASWGGEIYAGSIQFGQEKAIIVNQNIKPKNITITYNDMRNNQVYELNTTEMNDHKHREKHFDNYARLMVIEKIHKCIDIKENMNNNANVEIVNILEEILNNLKQPKYNRKNIIDLIKDIEKEIKKALSDEYYNSWGKKYLLSILNSHLYQECNNFKDPGVQHYTTPLFEKIRDKADDIFVSIPPPKPSRNISHYRGASSAGSRSRAPVNMNVYHNSSGPCFAPWCKVEMNNGTCKRVDEIKRGDLIKSINERGENDYSEVVCVIETEIENARCKLSNIQPNNLMITPWHPIRINNKWTFPENIDKSVERDCEKIYSFILNKNHIIYINEIECVTLGHGIKSDDVVSHEYFGNMNKLINDLSSMSGWNNGKIIFKKDPMIRDPQSGLVIKMVQK